MYIVIESRKTAVNTNKIEAISINKSKYSGKYTVVFFMAGDSGVYIYAERDTKKEAEKVFFNLLRTLQNVK